MFSILMCCVVQPLLVTSGIYIGYQPVSKTKITRTQTQTRTIIAMKIMIQAKRTDHQSALSTNLILLHDF